jgi:hypothetical protein
MRYIVELPGQQAFPMEAMNQLILNGAEVSKIPSPEQIALPGKEAVSDLELEKFISLAMQEKTTPSSLVFKRVKGEIGRNRG